LAASAAFSDRPAVASLRPPTRIFRNALFARARACACAFVCVRARAHSRARVCKGLGHPCVRVTASDGVNDEERVWGLHA
jgi:hypothetical protein